MIEFWNDLVKLIFFFYLFLIGIVFTNPFLLVLFQSHRRENLNDISLGIIARIKVARLTVWQFRVETIAACQSKSFAIKYHGDVLSTEIRHSFFEWRMLIYSRDIFEKEVKTSRKFVMQKFLSSFDRNYFNRDNCLNKIRTATDTIWLYRLFVRRRKKKYSKRIVLYEKMKISI